MSLDVVTTLCDLIRIPSINPMGRDVSGPEYFEYAVTDYLESLFRELGVACERQPVAPLRENILARFEGSALFPEQGGPLILFEAHQDTVPVEGMTIPPWTPGVDNGRVYGRGACDIKGGLASMLVALARLMDGPPRARPTVVMACTVNEEHGFTGATQLARSWVDGRSKLLPRAPDAIIVAEPTMLDVVVAHKGVVRWKCRAAGRACHSSQPESGDNAIYRMSRIVAALQVYIQDVLPQLGRHPRLGPPTLSVGLIQGGVSVNTVPDSCTIEIDRRLLPGEDPRTAYRHVVDYVHQTLEGDPHISHDEPYITAGGLSDETNGQLAALLSDVVGKSGRPARQIGVPFGTDAAAFTAFAPTVVFGPGSIEQAHTTNEWIAIEQLEQAADILNRLVSDSRLAAQISGT